MLYALLKWKSDLLNRAKAFCSSKSVFKNDVLYLRQMLFSNGYLIWFFNKFLRRFLTVDNDLSGREHSETNPVVYLNIPCIGKETRHFVSQLAKLFHVKFDVKLSAIYLQNLPSGDIFSAYNVHSYLALLKRCSQIYMFFSIRT